MAKQFDQDDCPFCTDGRLIPYSDGVRELTYKNKTKRQDNLHYSICNCCGLRGITEAQAEENKRLVAQFEDSLKDYISKKDIRRIRDKYRISQAEAGEIFGCGKSYFSKWETGDSAPTGPTAVFLKRALKYADVMQRLAEEVGVQITLPPQNNDTVGSFAEFSPETSAVSESSKAPLRIKKQTNMTDSPAEPAVFEEAQQTYISRPKLQRIK